MEIVGLIMNCKPRTEFMNFAKSQTNNDKSACIMKSNKLNILMIFIIRMKCAQIVQPEENKGKQ